ncbi:MAG: CopD family protein [Polyangiales bacterium]
MERPLLILLHVLGASVWIGGHLVLALSVLPRALRERDVTHIRSYEAAFERVGIPALLIQVATGLRLASLYAPPSKWLGFHDHVSRHLTLKLLALACTVALATHARLSLIPKLESHPEALRPLAYHIALVTLLAVAFALVGVSFRVGGLL